MSAILPLLQEWGCSLILIYLPWLMIARTEKLYLYLMILTQKGHMATPMRNELLYSTHSKLSFQMTMKMGITLKPPWPLPF